MRHEHIKQAVALAGDERGAFARYVEQAAPAAGVNREAVSFHSLRLIAAVTAIWSRSGLDGARA
jgi:hypothetical protein